MTMHVTAPPTHAVTVCGRAVPAEVNVIRQDLTDPTVYVALIPSADPDEWMGHAQCKTCLAWAMTIH